MRDILKNLMLGMGQLASYTIPTHATDVLASVRNALYTGFVRRRFKRFGRSCIKWKSQHLKGLQYIEIGDGCTFDADLQLTAWPCGCKSPLISIGNNCLIRYGSHITAMNKIVIGNNLLTGTNVLITDNSHGTLEASELKLPPTERPLHSKGEVHIGNNVWLGNNVCIMPGVTIGDGVIVGANSIVTKNIPSYALAVGAPAKIVKQIKDIQ